MTEEHQHLKACPICGCHARIVVKDGYFVKCKGCLLRTRKFLSLESAVEHWNTRSAEAVLAETLSRLPPDWAYVPEGYWTGWKDGVEQAQCSLEAKDRNDD